MSDTGRLIINTRGETFKAMREGDKVTLRTITLEDAVTWTRAGYTADTRFSLREAQGIIIQIANACGLAVEITPPRVNAATEARASARHAAKQNNVIERNRSRIP